MTLVLGTVCHDGVVIATDTQYTEDFFTTRGLKIFTVEGGQDHRMIIAGFDNADVFKRAVDGIKQSASVLFKSSDSVVSLAEIKSMVESSLAELFAKHLDKIPESERADYNFQLVIAIYVKTEGVHLFHTNRSMLVEDHHHVCFGEGKFVADWALDLFFPTLPSVEVGRPLSAFIIFNAKRFVSSVGFPTKVYALSSDGTDSRMFPAEIAEVERFYQEYVEAIKFPLFSLDLSSEVGLAGGDIIRDTLVRFRDAKRIRLARYEEAQKDLTLEPTQVRRVPKRDPSPPKP